jgi:thiol-disulfide isomerase/thioredoxin
MLLLLIFPLIGLAAAVVMIIGAQPQTAAPPPTPRPVTLPPTTPESARAASGAIPFTLTALDGSTVSLADFEGQPVLLNFWATWCVPCERELPVIADYVRTPGSLPVLAINLGESAAVVAPWLAERSIEGIPILLDLDMQVSGSYGIFNIPVTFGLDGDGVVRQQKFGEVTDEDLTDFASALGAGG